MTAQALAGAGLTVIFQATNVYQVHRKTPDCIIGDIAWEIKSPTSSHLAAVERNLKKACRQSENVIFDSFRMGRLPDASIERELMKQLKKTKSIKRLMFINRRRKVIDLTVRV